MLRTGKRIGLLMAALLCIATVSAAQVEPEVVTLLAEDNVTTVNSWFPRNDNGPVVILLHNAGATAGNFRTLITPMYEAGFQILAMDLRGHGRSKDPNPEVYNAMRSRQSFAYYGMKYDVDAAVKWLTEEKKIAPERICFVGGEWGSTLAIQAVAENDKLGGVVALSPSRNYFGLNVVNFMEAYGERPLYLILPKQLQSNGADQIADAMKENKQFKMKIFPRADLHGVDLLGTSWQVEGLIIEYLRDVYQIGSS